MKKLQLFGKLKGVASVAPKAKRGFAAMDPELQRNIARKGGKAVSRDHAHMAEIGFLGGKNSHKGNGK